MAKAPAKAEAPPAAEAGAPEKKTKGKLILIIAILLLLVIASGVAAWFFLGKKDQATEETIGPDGEKIIKVKKVEKKEPPKVPIYIVLDTFTVNLQSEGGEQFLQIALSIQVTDQVQGDMIKLYMPQVRSRLLLLFSSKKASEISTPEGKKKLTDEILLQTKLPFAKDEAAPGVTNVFITSFVIQ